MGIFKTRHGRGKTELQRAEKALEMALKETDSGLENSQREAYTENAKSGSQYSLNTHYWYPNLTKTELKELRRLAKEDIKTSINNITDSAN